MRRRDLDQSDAKERETLLQIAIDFASGEWDPDCMDDDDTIWLFRKPAALLIYHN